MVKNLGKFKRGLSNWAQKSQVRIDLALRLTALEAFKQMVERSPVLTGAFRGNWNVGVGEKGPQPNLTASKQITSNAPNGSPMTSEESARAYAEISKAKFGNTISITNSLPYALLLERGYSKKAPSGVLKVGFLALKEKFPEILERIKQVT